MLRVLASPMLDFVESPRLTLDLDHLGCREGVEYPPEIFSARSPDFNDQESMRGIWFRPESALKYIVAVF
jgi:hypothetical protein